MSTSEHLHRAIWPMSKVGFMVATMSVSQCLFPVPRENSDVFCSGFLFRTALMKSLSQEMEMRNFGARQHLIYGYKRIVQIFQYLSCMALLHLPVKLYIFTSRYTRISTNFNSVHSITESLASDPLVSIWMALTLLLIGTSCSFVIHPSSRWASI